MALKVSWIFSDVILYQFCEFSTKAKVWGFLESIYLMEQK